MVASRRGYWPVSLITIPTVIIMLVGSTPDLSSSSSAGSAVNPIWGTAQLMSTSPDNGAFIPVLKGDSAGRLMLVYNQMTDLGVENPYYRKSMDKGRTWQESAPIFQSDDSLLQVTFAFDSDDLAHAIWRTQTGIWHSSEDQWPNVANPITTTEQLVFGPDIVAAADDKLHAVWAQQDNRIYHAYSEDGGLNWDSSAALTDGIHKSDEPAIAADDLGNIHVVWEERIYDPDLGSFRFEVLYLSGSAGEFGVEWASSATLLSTGIREARRPSILTRADEVHVSFARRVADDEQYAHTIHYSPGSGWGPLVDVTNGEPVAMNTNIPFVLVPAMALCDDALYIYFHGSLVANGKELILGASSLDDWAARDQVDSGNVRTIRPSLACSGGILHMAQEEIVQPNVEHQVHYLSGLRFAVYLPVVTHD